MHMNPKEKGDRVLAGLFNVCQPWVKGAHDSDFVLVKGKAYIVYMANDVQPGEAADWPYIYDALSVVDLASGEVEQTITFAASEREYSNTTLPVGACFVPRILQVNENTLRCFFASEEPGKRQSQTWYLDYNLVSQQFDWTLHKARIKTSQGAFPMQPRHFYQQAVAEGFDYPQRDYGLYMIDSFKRFDGRVWAVLNNFPGMQNAWSVLNEDLNEFEVVGNYFLPQEHRFSESSVNRLPDGAWLAISRQQTGDCNYMFARSQDGASWSDHEYWALIPNGTESKPTFDCFMGQYYLGWQEATRINGAHRSVFNIEVSPNGVDWERKYRFETDKSFQYPNFREYEGAIYLTVTQGDKSQQLKERIMFGKLEDLPY